MTNKKYAFLEVGGGNCFLRTCLVNHTGRHYCIKDLQPCDAKRCLDCPYGKTLSEMAETANKEILNVMTGGKADSAPSHLSFTKRLYTGLNALLGGEGK